MIIFHSITFCFAQPCRKYINYRNETKHLDTMHRDGIKTSWGKNMKKTQMYVVHLVHEATSTES